jgi:ATP-dependent Clp protease protease subunit
MKKKIIPIGITQVPIKIFENNTIEWIDIYSLLYQEKVILLFQFLDDDFINQLIAMILYLDIENSTKSIYFYINSLGGDLISGIALYDTIRYVRSNVSTICMGITSSISSIILSSGEKGKRLILPHSRVMINQPESDYYGQASDILIESEEILRLRRLLAKIYVEQTNQSLSRIAKDIDRECFLSSREAQNYGIVDSILQLYSFQNNYKKTN